MYGKPKNEEDSVQTLRTFSNQSQMVYSGVCIYKGLKEKVTFHEGRHLDYGSEI